MKLPISISQEEFKKLMKATRKKFYKLAWALGALCGMRIGEIENLRKEDINFQKKSILIRQGKGGKDRIVPMPKGVPLSYYNELPIPRKRRAIQHAFQVHLKRAGINRPELHVHSLRHHFATHALESGIPLNQIQLLLGHSNIATTSVYLKANPKSALESYEKLF